jgi:hypothetical protein
MQQVKLNQNHLVGLVHHQKLKIAIKSHVSYWVLHPTTSNQYTAPAATALRIALGLRWAKSQPETGNQRSIVTAHNLSCILGYCGKKPVSV